MPVSHTDERALVAVHDLQVDVALHAFVRTELLPGTGVTEAAFWSGFDDLVRRFGPRNRELLDVRDALQEAIDTWSGADPAAAARPEAQRPFLESIGYLVPAGPPFTISTSGVDPEIASIAGPQLVVPVMNARYALNAANARWGSLYDALYGTDALGEEPVPGPYDPERGGRVIAWVRAFLDELVPLEGASHGAATGYAVVDGALQAGLDSGGVAALADPACFTGFTGEPTEPTSILLTHHGLGIELVVDRSSAIGASDAAGIADVQLESAVTAIMDLEDSIAAIDADDKVAAYRNWLGIMRGDLTEEVAKGGTTFTRRLAGDRTYVGPEGAAIVRRGRALLLVRNVGLAMSTPAVLDATGAEVPEGLLDALVTVTAALHDLQRGGDALHSRTGSVYLVKPKLHGPDEAAFVDEVLACVEDLLGLARDTVKVGIMDEERRTSVNLAACIRALASRVAFINTGFLDRTGDEIHTSMAAGPVVRKADMKRQPWIEAYERSNVETGLACGLRGRAQIGKGMWAAPALMRDMLEQKVAHLRAGATCAWVPSPTAATLHATHYHRVDVHEVQSSLVGAAAGSYLDDLLTIPLADASAWSAAEVLAELENNAQGILGYVVRWVDQGIGCSTVPDIHDVALMEDRATCRISSQLIANWLRHGVVDRAQVEAALRRMAVVVDRQNGGDEHYEPLAPAFDGPAFLAASDLVFLGAEEPNGYTETALHARRAERKRAERTRAEPVAP
ncbi:MAG: malate synthase [Actinomycetia bacterium]|nr:malate synthase [Actinomycetes bacterium]